MNMTSQHLLLNQSSQKVGLEINSPKIRRSMQKRKSELEISTISPWVKDQVIHTTYRTSKNSNQIWGSKKIIHEVHSPLLTGVKEADYNPKNKKELQLNLNERSAASIRDDNTLLD